MKTCSIIFFITLTLLSCGGPNGSGNQNRSNKDTVYFRMKADVLNDELLFNYVKANKWKPVYVFQLDEEDDYGNISWKNFSIIKDLSKEEFEEMKKYANFISYTNARIEGKTRNIKYSMSLLNK